jgi:CRISPR-associated protein Csm3
MPRLNNITTIEATLELVTGLRIGAGDSEMHIGGVDNTVIKHPLTGSPYIPGSSLKGKMRSLLEWRSGAVKEAPLGAKDLENADAAQTSEIKRILQLFGMAGNTREEVEANQKLIVEINAPRLAFWDCVLDPDWENEIRNNNQLLTEVKSENIINRISGEAKHPRDTERVPAGARFIFRLSLKELDGDDENLLDTVLQGLKLIEHDSLGGSGSRGYGKVKFTGLRINGEDKQTRFDQTPAFPARA